MTAYKCCRDCGVPHTANYWLCEMCTTLALLEQYAIVIMGRR